MKKVKSIAVLGIILNVVVAIFLILTSLRHPHWETLQLTPDARRLYYEKLLHILCDWTLPSAAGAMILSAYLFWKLRK